jgi:hypothetical protein
MSDTETRHYHGPAWHDHPGGNETHTHADRRDDPNYRPSGHGASAAFSFGTVFIVFGALGLVLTQNSHSACNSVLVQAASPSACSEANAIWTLGIIGLVLGLVLIIVGAILRSRERS